MFHTFGQTPIYAILTIEYTLLFVACFKLTTMEKEERGRKGVRGEETQSSVLFLLL